MVEEALRDPISVGQLKINGEFMIKELGLSRVQEWDGF